MVVFGMVCFAATDICTELLMLKVLQKYCGLNLSFTYFTGTPFTNMK